MCIRDRYVSVQKNRDFVLEAEIDSWRRRGQRPGYPGDSKFGIDKDSDGVLEM